MREKTNNGGVFDTRAFTGCCFRHGCQFSNAIKAWRRKCLSCFLEGEHIGWFPRLKVDAEIIMSVLGTGAMDDRKCSIARSETMSW